MTRAHVRHSPPFSIQRSLSRRGGEMSRFLSCLILLFIIALWAPLAKCSLYINNTGSIKSRRICFCSFFVCLYVWSHLCIIQFYLWLYNNCYYNYKDNWWACMHLSSVLPSRVYEFVRKRKKKNSPSKSVTMIMKNWETSITCWSNCSKRCLTVTCWWITKFYQSN